MKLATRTLAATPRASISRMAYLAGCAITVALWVLVIVIAAAIA